MKDKKKAKKKIIEQNSLEFKTKNLSEYEIYSFEKLSSYLNLKLQKPINFEDLNNVCYSLFCTVDILPEDLQSLKITKNVLALIRTEILIENFNEFSDLADSINEEYWIEQIRQSMINGILPNIENARILLKSD